MQPLQDSKPPVVGFQVGSHAETGLRRCHHWRPEEAAGVASISEHHSLEHIELSLKKSRSQVSGEHGELVLATCFSLHASVLRVVDSVPLSWLQIPVWRRSFPPVIAHGLLSEQRRGGRSTDCCRGGHQAGVWAVQTGLEGLGWSSGDQQVIPVYRGTSTYPSPGILISSKVGRFDDETLLVKQTCLILKPIYVCGNLIHFGTQAKIVWLAWLWSTLGCDPTLKLFFPNLAPKDHDAGTLDAAKPSVSLTGLYPPQAGCLCRW